MLQHILKYLTLQRNSFIFNHLYEVVIRYFERSHSQTKKAVRINGG